MSGWDTAIWVAGAILVVGPILVFFIYLKEIIYRVKHDDFT